MKVNCMSRMVAMVLMVFATLAWASPSAFVGFNADEGYVPGDMNGQGAAGAGWAGPWSSSAGWFKVVEGGSPATTASPGDPDQKLQMFGAGSSTYKARRDMNPWSGDFVFEFDAKYSLAGPLVTTQQIQFENNTGTTDGLRPLNIKWEANGLFRLNDQNMLTFNGNTAGFANMLADWVTVRVVCDWDTATFDLYWSNDTDGSLAYVGTKVGWKDGSFDGAAHTVQKFRIDAPKVTVATDGLEIDRITLVPEPMTLSLLALGAAAMTSRRRR